MSGVKINKETAQIDEGQFCENNLKGAKKILLLYRDVGFLFCFFVVLENIFCFIVDRSFHCVPVLPGCTYHASQKLL